MPNSLLASPPEVVLGVLTYRRPAELARILPALLDQAVDLERQHGCSVSVLVVDNDAEGSADAVARAAGDRVRYVQETEPGIAPARARAVVEAGSADALVFIDDDELPRPGWLVNLVSTWMQHGSPAGVAGRVTPTYPDDLDPWIKAGGFFSRRAYATGTAVPAASSANLLLNLDLLRELHLNFDAGLGMRGGEDTLLTSTLTRSGHEVVWCAEAEVLDLIPRARMNRGWVLRRSLSHGVAASRIEIALARHAVPVRGRLLLTGASRVLGGVLLAASGRVRRSLRAQALGSRLSYRGAGMVLGAIGYDLVEYKRSGS